MTFKLQHLKLKKNSPFTHTKLEIGRHNDKYEKEADAVANRVMRIPENFELNVRC